MIGQEKSCLTSLHLKPPSNCLWWSRNVDTKGHFTHDTIFNWSAGVSWFQPTLLIFGTKCEGKFVPDDRTIHVATEHVQCTGLGWWESWETDWQLTTVSANKRQAKILKECVKQWQADRMILPLGRQHWVTDFKKCVFTLYCLLLFLYSVNMIHYKALLSK